MIGEPMLEVKDVTKYYGKTPANQHVSFTIPDHAVAVLAGPNGAGKSTILKSIAGLLRYDGEILIDGFPNKSTEAKKRIGYVPEIPLLYGLLTVDEHLEFVARAHKLDDSWRARADQLIERFELTPHRKKLGSALSKGMQQKVSVCTALIHRPTFVIFDEPMVGLDPHAIKELKTIFRELADDGHTMLVSTHILDSVDELFDQLLVMKDGRIKAQATRAYLDREGIDLEDFFFRYTEGDSPAVAAGEA